MAGIGKRPDIEGKVGLIANRIVRGRLAKENRSVTWYRLNRVTTITASAMTSIGLANPLLLLASGKGGETTLSQAFDSWSGLPKWLSILGVMLFVIGAVALAFYRQEKTEEKAIQSLALAEAMDRLEVDLQQYLELTEPLEQLNGLYERASALEATNFLVIPKLAEHRKDIADYTSSAVAEYSKWWGENPPLLERREKNAA